MGSGFISLAALLAFLALATGLPFKDECLFWHNHYRTIHQAGPLKWSNDLQRKAQAYADELAAKNKFGNDGESSVVLWPGLPSQLCKRSVDFIYEEEESYNYNSPGYAYATGHFTVMVWKSSTELGAAYARNPNGKTWVIFKYKPLGNIGGQYRDNVFPPLLPLCNATLDTPVTRAPCRWLPTTAPPTSNNSSNTTIGPPTSNNSSNTTIGPTEGGIPGVKSSAVEMMASLWLLFAAGLLLHSFMQL